MRGWLLVLPLAGCDEVFDLVEVAPRQDAVADAFIRPGLVAWYPMEEIAGGRLVDIVGDHEGACIGSACPVATVGVRGNALLFDGTSQVINALSSSAVNMRGDFTVAAWVRQDTAAGDGSGCPFSKLFGTSGTNTWQVCSYLGTWVFYSSSMKISIGAVDLGRWQHFAVTWNADTHEVLIYVDGVEKVTGALDVVFDTGRIMFGADDDAGVINGWLPGAVDEVQIFNRALPPRETLELVLEQGG